MFAESNPHGNLVRITAKLANISLDPIEEELLCRTRELSTRQSQRPIEQIEPMVRSHEILSIDGTPTIV